MRATVVTLTVLMGVTPALAATPPRPTVTAGALRLGGLLDGDFEHGCGFSASSDSSDGANTVLIATWGEDENLHIFVDGKLRLLRAHGDYGGWADRIGQSERFEFGDASANATIELTSTWVCPTGSSGCELAKYRGTLKLKVGDKSAEVAIHAEGGC